jgi:hypothetical protein
VRQAKGAERFKKPRKSSALDFLGNIYRPQKRCWGKFQEVELFLFLCETDRCKCVIKFTDLSI